MPRSAAKSVTRRKALANDARKYLATYQQVIGLQKGAEDAEDHDADARADLMHDQATKRLLWAEAKVQQALYLQTNGRLGSKDATLMTVLREHEARRP